MHQECDISIITINYNGLNDTCALIDTIPFDEDSSLEVIVVDNASDNDEATIIEQRFPQVTVVRSQKNLGFAGGNNLGIKAAHGHYLFFINNDTLLFRGEQQEESRKDVLQLLVSRLERSANIGAVCPKIRFAWDDAPIQYAGYTPLSHITMRNKAIGCGEKDEGQYDTPHPTPYVHGAAMMVKCEAIERAGLMPECYFLYYEELDWSMMLRRAGYDLWYEPMATIYHKESRSTGQASPLKTYYLVRNRLLFAKRNISGLPKYATYTYLIGVVGLRDIIINTLKGRRSHLKATVRAIHDFFRSRFSVLNSQF